MLYQPRKQIFEGGAFPYDTSGELREMIVRRWYGSEEDREIIMAEIGRREKLGIDDISRTNAAQGIRRQR